MESTDFSRTINGYKKTLIAVIISFTLIIVSLGFLYLKEKANHEAKIYVIADNGRFLATQTSAETLYDFDMRNQIKLFCDNMFAYDQYNFNDNLETGLNLIDDIGGKRIYNDLKTSGVYENLKKYNARTKIKIDSLVIDTKVRPIAGVFYCTQSVLYSDQSAKLPIAAKFNLISTTRSEKNPFGMMITNFDYIKYDIGVNKVIPSVEQNKSTTEVQSQTK